MPAIGSVHKASITYGDVTEETSKMEVFIGAITALSVAGFLTNFGDLQTKTDAITLGTRRKQQWIGDDTVVTNAWPTDRAAQREAKLKVTYQDTTTEQNYTLTIPTIDFDVLNFVPGSGDHVLFEGADASDAIKDWVTSFETIAKSPDNDTHAVEVIDMQFIGVNS